MRSSLAVLIATVAVLACVGATEEGKPGEDDIRAVAAADLAFATDLYPLLAANDQNLVFCPPGVAGLLALAGTGSRGPTRTSLLSVLPLPGASEQTLEAFGDWRARLAGKSDERTTLEWTSTVLSDPSHPLLAAFQDMARLKFNAEIPTEPSLDPDTGIVLKSRVHFFGHWRYEFAAAATKPGPFFLAGGREVSVPFMHTETDFKFYHETGRLFGLGPGRVSLLELPYGNGTYSMVVILPDRRTGLADLEGSLSAATLAEWLESLDKSEPKTVILSLPRFDTHSELRLMEALTSMGLGPAGKIYVADFSQVSSNPTYISKVVQNAAVKVDEAGTEAEAETVVVLSPFGVGGPPPPEPRVVKVDHPFVFLIRDNTTGAPLFMGRISDPTR
jgi:serpin B